MILARVQIGKVSLRLWTQEVLDCAGDLSWESYLAAEQIQSQKHGLTLIGITLQCLLRPPTQRYSGQHLNSITTVDYSSEKSGGQLHVLGGLTSGLSVICFQSLEGLLEYVLRQKGSVVLRNNEHRCCLHKDQTATYTAAGFAQNMIQNVQPVARFEALTSGLRVIYFQSLNGLLEYVLRQKKSTRVRRNEDRCCPHRNRNTCTTAGSIQNMVSSRQRWWICAIADHIALYVTDTRMSALSPPPLDERYHQE